MAAKSNSRAPAKRRGIGSPVKASKKAARCAVRNKAAVPAAAKLKVSTAAPSPVGMPSAAKANANMPAPQGPARLMRQKAVSYR
ncbi:hypothetical protein D1872_312060 [compost metagenome]